MARHSSGPAVRAEYALFSAATSILKALPLPRAARLGAGIGSVAAVADRVNRPIAMRNLDIAFPERTAAQKRQILTGMYRNWGRMAAEWCHAADYTSATISRFVTYDGFENWQAGQRLSAGRGEVIITGHFGNFELLSAAHALYGHQVAIVYRPLRNLMIDSAVAKRRTEHGNLTIARKGAGREIMTLLRRNHDVVIPIDLDVRRGVFVDLFSLKASTTDAVARVALAGGATVLPVFMVRQGETLQHKIVIHGPIKLERGADRELAVREYTQFFSSIFETMVRRYPDHWNWIHRRWKTRPPGEQRFY